MLKHIHVRVIVCITWQQCLICKWGLWTFQHTKTFLTHRRSALSRHHVLRPITFHHNCMTLFAVNNFSLYLHISNITQFWFHNLSLKKRIGMENGGQLTRHPSSTFVLVLVFNSRRIVHNWLLLTVHAYSPYGHARGKRLKLRHR